MKNDVTEPEHGLQGALDDLSPSFYDQEDSENVCIVCAEPRYRPVHEVTHFGFPFHFQRCRCGTVKQTPMPNKKFFDWFFNSQIFFSAKNAGTRHIWGFFDVFKDEPSRSATGRYRYRRLNHIFAANRSLDMIEIGPSTGTFLDIARRHGHNTMGCDLSAEFIKTAHETYELSIDHGYFEDQGYAAGSFDVVIFYNVLENIPNPAEFFAAIHCSLRDDCHIVFNFVDMKNNWLAALQGKKYFMWRPPICYAYQRTVIDRMLAQSGFERIDMFRDIRYLHLEKILTLLGWKWAYKIAKMLGVSRILFPIYAYPSRLVVARKISR